MSHTSGRNTPKESVWSFARVPIIPSIPAYFREDRSITSNPLILAPLAILEIAFELDKK
jgi:hypothetical protein